MKIRASYDCISLVRDGSVFSFSLDEKGAELQARALRKMTRVFPFYADLFTTIPAGYESVFNLK